MYRKEIEWPPFLKYRSKPRDCKSLKEFMGYSRGDMGNTRLGMIRTSPDWNLERKVTQDCETTASYIICLARCEMKRQDFLLKNQEKMCPHMWNTFLSSRSFLLTCLYFTVMFLGLRGDQLGHRTPHRHPGSCPMTQRVSTRPPAYQVPGPTGHLIDACGSDQVPWAGHPKHVDRWP